jgi:predicted permease
VTRYPAGKDIALHQRREEAIAAVPGVESVAPATDAYVSDDQSSTDFFPEGEVYDPQKKQEEDFNAVGTQFFETLKIPLVAGRGFGPQDSASSPKVGIINEALAKRRFPGVNPLGKRFSLNGGHNTDGHGGKFATDLIEIVGICGDVRYVNLRDEPPAQFYLPYVQQGDVGGMTYEIRTHGRPEDILPAVRKVVQQVDPDLPLAEVRTQEQQIASDLNQERLFVLLTSGFGLLALVLACVGIYGVMAYSVSRRTNEIGIRLALGALPRQVLGMVLGEAWQMAAVGIGVGLVAAVLLGRLVRSMLYGVEPNDPVTVACGVLVLLAVALGASWIPARRAAGVQPVQALRHE